MTRFRAIGRDVREESDYRSRGDFEAERQLATALELSTIEADVGTTETAVPHKLAKAPRSYSTMVLEGAAAAVSESRPADARNVYLVASSPCPVRVTLFS